jgi:glycosyltransferase involved in cell wall biosynthesis
MKHPRLVYILVLNGEAEQARRVAEQRYPDCETRYLSKRKLREGGWKQQMTELRTLNGEAFLVFVNSIGEVQEPLLLKLTTLFHRCAATVIADSHGRAHIVRHRDAWKLLPETLAWLIADAFVLLVGWMGLSILRLRITTKRRISRQASALNLAYLYPFPMDRSEAGGAMSHVRGFLAGLAQRSVQCEVFSGRPLSNVSFPVHELPNTRTRYVFRESLALSYNLRFVRRVRERLNWHSPLFIYQRHGRFVVAGALLSRQLGCPLVLEYNGSEYWISKHWDPGRFSSWLKLCEEISLAAASLIVVVSEALQQELIALGIPAERILINPNAVDPARFHPDCGGQHLRTTLGFAPDHIVIGFIGSFSYWHGITVLQQTIHSLLEAPKQSEVEAKLRFLLVGDGPLREEMRAALEPYRNRGWVVFTGQVPHDQAASYLDSADILASPHVPMPDDKPFFGSPTKLFEYMAMGKAIVASNLDQLGRVLTHQQTAWLVEPGNATELASAIRLLSSNPALRRQLGENARKAALASHTWEQNAIRVLSQFRELDPDFAPDFKRDFVANSQ